MKVMKTKEIIRLLEKEGWYLERIKGDHRHFKHPLKKGVVTVPGKLSDNMPQGTTKSIFKQAGLI